MREQKLRSVLQVRVNWFYILAFAPLLPLLLYRYTVFNDAMGVFVPFYGFLILLTKKDKLAEYSAEISKLQATLGLAVIVFSFFAYYIIVPIDPTAGIYGIANYTMYLFGLILLFFKPAAFKQTFTALFLIVAVGITGLSYRWIEHQIKPIVPYYVSMFSVALKFIGMNHTQVSADTLFLNTPRGILPVWFEGGCIGVYSVILFSILVVVTMMETSAPKLTKLLWAVGGIAGVFLLNVVRLIIVIATMYTYGWDFGQQVHQVAGYIIFLSWLGIFLFIFSKRQAIANRFRKNPAQAKLALKGNEKYSSTMLFI